MRFFTWKLIATPLVMLWQWVVMIVTGGPFAILLYFYFREGNRNVYWPASPGAPPERGREHQGAPSTAPS